MDRRALLIITAICMLAVLACLGILRGGKYLSDLAERDEKIQTIKEARLTLEAFEVHSMDLVSYVDAYLLALRASYQRNHSLDDARYYVKQAPFDKTIVDSLAIIDAEGKLIFSTREFKQIDVSDRDYFLEQQNTNSDQLFFSPVLLGKSSSKYLFRVSRRLVNPDGSFAGVVLAAIDPLALSRFYRDLRMGQQSVIAMVGTNDHKLRARFPMPEVDKWGIPEGSRLWAELTNVAAGTYEAVNEIDRIQRTHVYKKLPAYPLAVIVGFSDNDVKARMLPQERRQNITELILIGFVVGMALLLIVVTINRQRLAKANRDLQGLYEQVRGMALFDALTGLPNRTLLEDRLLQALLDSERNQECCALIYLDLDDFKIINDTIGHDAGDHVLEVTASRMLAAVRATDTVSRRGGDEFVILLPHAGTLPEILEIADRLIHWIAEPINFKGTNCAVSASLGVAIYPGDGLTLDEMLKAADDAMYVAKRKGKNTLVLASDKIMLNVPEMV